MLDNIITTPEDDLGLNAPIATKVVCFSHLLKCLRSLYGKQCGPRPDCSGSTLFAAMLNLSVMLGSYLQQTTSADDIFRCIFFLGALRVNIIHLSYHYFLIKTQLLQLHSVYLVILHAF